jgi:hypothetical protein
MTWAVIIACYLTHCREIAERTDLSLLACRHALPTIAAQNVRPNERISRMECFEGDPV